jgi:hypothetical protein
MVTPKETLGLIIGLSAITCGIVLSYVGVEDAERSDKEMIERLEIIEQDQLEIGKKQRAMLDKLDAKLSALHEPVPEPRPKPPKVELKMPWDQMFDCVYSYDMDLSPIDTVAKPMIHNSWVLGGECERLAHDLRDKEYPGEVWNAELADTLELKGMCVGYTDDSPIEAAKCQKNMQRWLEVLCWNTLEDNEIRACKRTHLMTTLDHEADERP